MLDASKFGLVQDALKIERNSITTLCLVCLIALSQNRDARRLPGWVNPLLDAPTDTARCGGITSASLLAAWDACANAWETGFRGLAIYFHYWAKKKRRTR